MPKDKTGRENPSIDREYRHIITIAHEFTVIKEHERFTIKLREHELVLTHLQALHLRNILTTWANDERRRIHDGRNAPGTSIPENEVE